MRAAGDPADAAAILLGLPRRPRRAPARHPARRRLGFRAPASRFQPAVLMRWDGDTPRVRRVSLDRRPREMSNLKFPHALHLDRNGGVAQMGRRLGAAYGFGQQLVCADCHVATPDGTRFQPPDMEGDCGMCHSLAFETIDGTVRTLRHGEPRQVVADIRSFYRAGLRVRPVEFGTERSRRATSTRSAPRCRPPAPGRHDRPRRFGRAPGLLAGQGLLRLPPGAAGRGRLARLRHPAGRLPDPPCCTAGSTTAPTRSPSGRASRARRAPGLPQLPPRRRLVQNSTDLLLPNMASCRDCHGGETTSLPVGSSCAMCHDYHMDEGVPARLLRQVVRGRRWTTTVIPVEPQRGLVAAHPVIGAGGMRRC